MANEPNPKKVEDAPKEGTTVVDNETLPAVAETTEAAEVFFDENHDGVTGTQLADADRPQLFKLDHKKGFIHPWDDDEEKYDYIVGVIVNARTSYRRFGPSGPCCESDNGITGYDQELQKEINCKTECKFSYDLEEKIDGKCGLGLQLQLLADMDGNPVPLQFNGSSTSARNFANFLKKLNRRNLKVRDITVKLSSRFIKGRQQDYYAAKFEVEAENPCFDISALIKQEMEMRHEPNPEATEV